MKLLPLLAALALCGCETNKPTEIKFDFGGTNKFTMTSSKEVSAKLMSLTMPNGTSILLSNYTSKINSPTDAMAEALKELVQDYVAKKTP